MSALAVGAQGQGTAGGFISNEHAQSKIYDFCSPDDVPYTVAELQQIKGSRNTEGCVFCNEGKETEAIRR